VVQQPDKNSFRRAQKHRQLPLVPLFLLKIFILRLL
jgi:hypothetical protein